MHKVDLTLDEITKVEGAAALDVKVRDGKVEHVHFGIEEYKRFYTTAMKGKPIAALPQLLARICGTCSNAHLLASIEACENALGIKPTEQSMLLKKLVMYGLNIRDHALHLYLFVLPDLYEKDAFLELDENDPEQHQHLHDAFEIKAAGNYLSQIIGGRSVHAMHPTIGGFKHFPTKDELKEAVKKLKAARPAVLRCIETFKNAPWTLDIDTQYMALMPHESFGFLEGRIIMSDGTDVEEADYRSHLEHVVIPYSQASGYHYKGRSFMVGSVARLNLAKELLHKNTQKDAAEAIALFPSTNVFHNNLAQAIEILHCLDHTVEILESTEIKPEEVITAEPREAVGVGVVEAPRGTLYHKVVLQADGRVKEGEVIVPTGQNQINIEKHTGALVEELIKDESMTEEKLQWEIEKMIRSYDPCMSCASHFLKLNLEGVKLKKKK
jgi:coenzyme F420-reducing hydrogenase alpha subunit